MARGHFIIPTHTPRHLRRTLLTAASQGAGRGGETGAAAASITVSCDNDSSEVREVVRKAAAELGVEIGLVQRGKGNEVRVGQVRNNGVWALLARGADERADVLLLVDGDSCPIADFSRMSLELCHERDLVVGGRINMTPEQTAAFDETAVRQGRPPCVATAAQWAEVRQRQKRYVWQQRLKPLGLIKAHKPKILGASHAIRLSTYIATNGYNEAYTGGFQEDDDMGRRIYQAGGRSAVAVDRLIVYHQWHETRKQKPWKELPSAAMLDRGGPIRCAYGLATPVDQAPLRAWVFSGHGERELTLPRRPGDGAAARGTDAADTAGAQKAKVPA